MDIPCVRDVPNKSVGQLSGAAQQTMPRRRYSSTMRMEPLAECCSFTAHNPQQSQLKQQFSSYLIFLIRPVLGPRKTTTRSCAAVPCSHEPPSFRGPARCTARHVFTDTARGARVTWGQAAVMAHVSHVSGSGHRDGGGDGRIHQVWWWLGEILG